LFVRTGSLLMSLVLGELLCRALVHDWGFQQQDNWNNHTIKATVQIQALDR